MTIIDKSDEQDFPLNESSEDLGTSEAMFRL